MASRLGVPPLLWTPTTLLEYTDYLHKYTPDPIDPVAHIQSVFVVRNIELNPAKGTLKLTGEIDDFHYDGSLYNFFGQLKKHVTLGIPNFTYNCEEMPLLGIGDFTFKPEEYINMKWEVGEFKQMGVEDNELSFDAQVFLDQWKALSDVEIITSRFELARANPSNWQNNEVLKNAYLSKWNEANELAKLWQTQVEEHTETISISNNVGYITDAFYYCGIVSVYSGGNLVENYSVSTGLAGQVEIHFPDIATGTATVTWKSCSQGWSGTDEQLQRLYTLNRVLWSMYEVPPTFSMPQLMVDFGGATPMAEAMGISLEELLLIYATPELDGLYWNSTLNVQYDDRFPPPTYYGDFSGSYMYGELGIGFDVGSNGSATLYTGMRFEMYDGAETTIPEGVGYVGKFKASNRSHYYFFMHSWSVPWFTQETQNYSAKVLSFPIKPAYIYQTSSNAVGIPYGFYSFQEPDEPMVIPYGNVRVRGQIVKYDYVNQIMDGVEVKRAKDKDEINQYNYELTLLYSPIYSFKQPNIYPTPMIHLVKTSQNSDYIAASGFCAVPSSGDGGARTSGGPTDYEFNTSTFDITVKFPYEDNPTTVPMTYFTSFDSVGTFTLGSSQNEEQFGKFVSVDLAYGDTAEITVLDNMGNTMASITVNGEEQKLKTVSAQLLFPEVKSFGPQSVFLDSNFTPFLQVGQLQSIFEIGSDDNAT